MTVANETGGSEVARINSITSCNPFNLVKKNRLLVAALFAATFVVSGLQAQNAKITRIAGDATVANVTTSDGVKTPLTLGMSIAPNSTITTGAGVEVALEAFDGATAAIKANSSVLVEKLGASEAVLDLKKGSIVSQLDPAKKATNKYSVRTPKGVAAARGTAYAISIDFSGGTNFSTLEGTVTLTPIGGGAPITMPFGTASINGAAAQALSAAIASNPSLATDIAAAVQTVSANVQNGASGAGSGSTTVTVLAAVVSAAAQALPSQAATFTQQAIAAVTSSSSAAGASSGAAATAAVQAITTAAVTAAPAQAAAISSSAAVAAVQAAVTNSLASNPGNTAAAAAAAQSAAQAVQSATVAAVNTAVATGAISLTSAATITDITTSVQTGAISGTTQATAGTPNVVVTPPTVTVNTAQNTPVSTPPVTPPTTPIDPSVVSPSR